MKCSACKKQHLSLIKIKSKLLCQSCLNDLVKKEDDAESSKELDYKLFDNYNSGEDTPLNAFQYQSDDQHNFVVKIEEAEIKKESNDSDAEDSKQFAFSYEESASLDGSSNQMLNDEDAQTEKIQIKEELTIEEAEIQSIDDTESENSNKKLRCKYCSVRCGTHRELKNHFKDTHSEVRQVGCSICNNKFQGETLYRQHLQEEHDGFGGVCKICQEQFRESGEVQGHKKHCLGRLLFTCNSCEKSYVSKESVSKHFIRHCTGAAKVFEKRIKQQFFTCAICDDGMAYEKDPYWKHIKETHNGHSIRCKYCPNTFTTKSTRARHMKFMCTNSEQFIRQDLKCLHCPKRFVTRHSLGVHVKTVHPTRPMTCNVCQLQFKNFFALHYHKKKVHTEPEHQCPYCSKKFHHSNYYRKHLEMHQNERNILCDLCGLAFNTRYNFRSHYRSRHQSDAEHRKTTSENPTQPKYECKECAKSFEKRLHYENHMTLHNSDQQKKPNFFCEDCNLVFTSKSTIQAHLKHSITHMKVKCKQCKTVFSNAKGYDEHLRNKTCGSA